jgi:hypothetical protein
LTTKESVDIYSFFDASYFSNFHLALGLSWEHFSTVIFFLSSLIAKQFLLLPCWTKLVWEQKQRKFTNGTILENKKTSI